MTAREKLKMEYPEKVSSTYSGGCMGCPHDYGYLPKANCGNDGGGRNDICTKCWDREIPEDVGVTCHNCRHFYPIISLRCATCKDRDKFEPSDKGTSDEPHILDSGNRREFETGAVRDIQEGKGRCDLLPLDVVAAYIEPMYNATDWVLHHISKFQEYGDEHYLFSALNTFQHMNVEWGIHTLILETAIHFEEGAKKYGENNWQKGIPVHCYIDSAVRHYLKFLRGDKDERHDRAFCWNIMCAIWTCKHKPELNEYLEEGKV